MAPAGVRKRGVAVARDLHLVTLEPQIFLKPERDSGFVLNHQNLRHSGLRFRQTYSECAALAGNALHLDRAAVGLDD